MKQKIVKLSSFDLEKLVRRIVKEDNGKQLSLEFPDYDDRHPYLAKIERKLHDLNIESRVNQIVESLSSINLISGVDIDNELTYLEHELQSLEKEIYDEELPNKITWGVSERVTNLLDAVYDLQEISKDIENLVNLYERITTNLSQSKK